MTFCAFLAWSVIFFRWFALIRSNLVGVIAGLVWLWRRRKGKERKGKGKEMDMREEILD